MAKKKETVTNAMRMLKADNIEFVAVEYEYEGEISDNFGKEISKKTKIPENQSFKTLVIRGESKGIYVACIPVDKELDLKKAAKILKEKKVEMIHVKELLSLTGYIRGGVSPVGMKKKYPTLIEESCLLYDKIAISAGVCGCTLLLNPESVIKVCDATACDIVKD